MEVASLECSSSGGQSRTIEKAVTEDLSESFDACQKYLLRSLAQSRFGLRSFAIRLPRDATPMPPATPSTMMAMDNGVFIGVGVAVALVVLIAIAVVVAIVVRKRRSNNDGNDAGKRMNAANSELDTTRADNAISNRNIYGELPRSTVDGSMDTIKTNGSLARCLSNSNSNL